MSDKNTFSSVCLVLLLLLGIGTILFMAPGPFLGNASGLVINGVHTITGTETYDEDIIISNTGHLRIVDGGTLKLGIGHFIFVNGGALSVLGNSSVRSKITCSAMGGRFGGIVANRDARLNFTYANLQWADEMLVCDGTGRAASAGHVHIVESWISMSTRGLRFGDGVPSHPYVVRFANNRVQTTQTALAITTAYNDISITGSDLSPSKGTAVDIWGGGGGGGAGRIMDCSISGEVCGLSVTNHQKMEIGNCSISGYRALRLEKLYAFYVHNNTATSKYRGMYCYSIDKCTFENNAFIALSYTTSIAVELEQTMDIEFHENILSSHGFAMTMNLSSGDIVERNLLTNLLGKDYRDLDGDGFCDMDPLLPGNAAMYARRCRTSIVPLDGTGPTFVNPKMATDFAEDGDKLFMYCFPKDYGPQGGRFRSLIHTEMPYFERPLHLMGEEMESLWFLPPEGAAGPVFMGVEDASLSNVTIGSTKYGTNIDTSSNISVSDITYGYLLFFGGDGLTAARSNDVDMVRIRSTFENSPLVQLDHCDRVTLDGLLSVWESGDEVIAKDCSDLRISEMETSLHSGNAIVLDHCSGRVERCKLDSAYSSLVMESCHDMVISSTQFKAGFYPTPIIKASNITKAVFMDSEFHADGKGADYRAVELTYDVRDVFFSRCIFSNDQPPNATGLYVNGLASDVRLSDCFFFNLSCGVYLEEAGDGRSSVRDPPAPMASGHQLERCDFHNNDVGVDFRGATSLRLAGNTLLGGGIGVQAMGDLDLVGNTFHGGLDVGVKVSEWGITASRLTSTGTFFVNDKGTPETAYDLRKTQFLIKDDYIESPIGIRSVGCGGSLVVHSYFFDGVPIIVSPLADEVNTIELNDCEGDRTSSVCTEDGCSAVWTYSLNISVLDEVGSVQPSELKVTSAKGIVLFDGTTDGTELLQSVVGYIKGHTTSDHSMNDYKVEANDGDGYDDAYLNMSRPRSITLVLDHSPVLTGSAPALITFDEDSSWEGDVTSWFSDRDALIYSVPSITPSELDHILQGSMLNISAETDWNGAGQFIVKAQDTFGKSVTASIDVEVRPVNDPPYFTGPLPEMTTEEDTPIWVNLSGLAADIDSAELSWSNWTAFNCTIKIDPAGEGLTLSPIPDWYGSLEVTLILSDGQLKKEAVLRVNVTPVNDPPVWMGDDPVHLEVNAGEIKLSDIELLVSDVDNIFSSLSISASSPNVTYQAGKLSILYPSDTRNMTENITITISDGELSTSFHLLVKVIERPPTPKQWRIDDADIEVDEKTGDWTVTVKGEEGKDIWIVIDGVGSFKLEETSPGNYSVVIPGSSFDSGEEYSYHFSDISGGPDRTGGQFAGTKTQPDGPDDGDEDKLPWWVPVLIIGLLLLILLGVAAYMMGRKTATGDEEASSWDMEE